MNNINKYIFEFEDNNIIVIYGNTFDYIKLINDPNNNVLIEALELTAAGKLRKVSVQ